MHKNTDKNKRYINHRRDEATTVYWETKKFYSGDFIFPNCLYCFLLTCSFKISLKYDKKLFHQVIKSRSLFVD